MFKIPQDVIRVSTLLLNLFESRVRSDVWSSSVFNLTSGSFDASFWRSRLDIALAPRKKGQGKPPKEKTRVYTQDLNPTPEKGYY